LTNIFISRISQVQQELVCYWQNKKVVVVRLVSETWMLYFQQEACFIGVDKYKHIEVTKKPVFILLSNKLYIEKIDFKLYIEKIDFPL
jgi:hypothetical protein